MPSFSFVQTHYDMSTESGFQFRFHCDRCGNGFLSTVAENRRSITGKLFGGFGGKRDLHQVPGETPHDRAMRKAVAEMKPLFAQCGGCGKWVCRPVCWNAEKGKCKDCAPPMGEDVASAQAEAARERAADRARTACIVAVMKAAVPAVAVCPKCGADTHGGKFCPECGTTLTPAELKCAACGVPLADGAKFCPECGTKV